MSPRAAPVPYKQINGVKSLRDIRAGPVFGELATLMLDRALPPSSPTMTLFATFLATSLPCF
jgi:hypothetical protein